MATPTSYAVTIYVNDVDVSTFVSYETMSLDDNRRSVSSFRCVVENPSGVTPARGHSVKVIATQLAGTPIIFLGNIVELKTKKRDNGITVLYDIEALDYKYRLQKSVIDIAELSGSDSTILSGLLSNAYPDLSSLFDFSSGVTSFASGLLLPTGNKNILDALTELSDLAGGAEFRFDNVAGGYTIDFDGGASYTYGDTGAFTASIGGGGNGGNCLIGTATNPSTNDGFYVEYVHSGVALLDSIEFDYYVDVPATSDWAIYWLITDPVIGVDTGTLAAGTDDAGWTTDNDNDNTGNPNYPSNGFMGTTFRVGFYVSDFTPAAGTWEARLDNITFNFNGDTGTDTTRLNWGNTPDVADFDIDIDLSDEFGFNFDLTEGDYNNFNSITVIGGHSETGVLWIYESDGTQDHFKLEPFSEITTIETNTGTDISPSWTAIDIGEWGTDENGVGGIDVLWDKVGEWLYFDNNPPALANSFRITGTILKPIRIRVEDIGSGEATYATTYVDENITSQDQAEQIGVAKLAKRNAARHLEFTTHNPGLKVGQSINVVDSNRGLNETLTIQRIQTTWLNNLGIFAVECGEDETPTGDAILANNDKRSRANQLQAGVTTITANIVRDALDRVVTDALGRIVTGA